MNAHSQAFARPPEAARAAPGNGGGNTSIRWAALQEAGAVVCALAGAEPERIAPEVRNFPAMIGGAGGWRRELAEKGIDDLAALMEPGIAALLAVNARGVDATAAAGALWREFLAARAALIALLPPSGELGPVRKA